MTDKNPITGDLLQSRMNTKEFEENFDRIFRKHLTEHKETHQRLAEYELNPSTGDFQKRFVDGVSKPNGEQFDNESDSTES